MHNQRIATHQPLTQVRPGLPRPAGPPAAEGAPVDRFQPAAAVPTAPLTPRQRQELAARNDIDRQKQAMLQAQQAYHALKQRSLMAAYQTGNPAEIQELQRLENEARQAMERAKEMGYQADGNAILADSLVRAARQGRISPEYGQVGRQFLEARQRAYQTMGVDPGFLARSEQLQDRMENNPLYRYFAVGDDRETVRRSDNPPTLEEARPRVDEARQEIDQVRYTFSQQMHQLRMYAYQTGDLRVLQAVSQAESSARQRLAQAQQAGYYADADALYADELLKIRHLLPPEMGGTAQRYLAARSRLYAAVGESDALLVKKEELQQRLETNPALQYAMFGRTLPR